MKCIKLLLSGALALTGVFSSYAYDIEAGGIYYNIISKENKTLEVTKPLTTIYYKGAMKVPANVSSGGDVYTVTAVGKDAFKNCSMLTSLELPSNITSIGDYAFQNTTSLETVNIPENVESIGIQAFYNCQKITKLIIPEKVTKINMETFRNCKSLASLEMGNNITVIDKYAFAYCSNLAEFNLPTGVETINDQAFAYCSKIKISALPEKVKFLGTQGFYGCNGIERLSIPATLDSIGWCALSHCENLSAINVAAGNAKYASVDGVLYSKNIKILIQCPGARTSLDISSGVEILNGHSFYGCSKLESVLIPNSVKNIMLSAFTECGSLTALNIPESVTEIGSKFVYGCKKLKSINVSPQNKNYTSVDGALFSKNLQELVTCPPAVEKFSIPEGTVTIGNSAFIGCSMLSELNIPETVTAIGDDAFYECSALTKFTLPNSLKSIGKRAFSGLKNLKEIELGNSLETIDMYAFQQCSALKAIVLPATLKSIGMNAFFYAAGLTSITCEMENPFECSPGFNDAVYNNCELTVPKGKINDYKKVSPWKSFKTVKEALSGVESLEISNGPEIVVVGNGIVLCNAEGLSVDIYGVDGKHVYAQGCYSGQSISLPRGYYIICAGNHVLKIRI